MIIRTLTAGLTALSITACASAQEIGPIASFNPADYSQEMTECDRLAAHPDDPYKVGPGTPEGKVDLPAAIAACREAVSNDPENPRLRYQLARAYGYSGRGEEAMPHRLKAVEAGYPQSLFVVGYLYVTGRTIEQDTCLGARLIHESAKTGRFAGLTFYPAYVTDGTFRDCDTPASPEILMDFLDEADAMTEDSYKDLLISTLRARIAERGDLAAIAACHKAASHPDDPDRTAPGLEREEIDLPAAITACQKAHALAPLDARVSYHLGRVLYYNGQIAEALPYLTWSAEAGYRQAIFVLAYVRSFDEVAGKDICRSGTLWQTALSRGHPWSGYHLAEKAMEGAFGACNYTVSDRGITDAMCFARQNITPEASDGRVEALYERYRDEMRPLCQ